MTLSVLSIYRYVVVTILPSRVGYEHFYGTTGGSREGVSSEYVTSGWKESLTLLTL